MTVPGLKLCLWFQPKVERINPLNTPALPTSLRMQLKKAFLTAYDHDQPAASSIPSWKMKPHGLYEPLMKRVDLNHATEIIAHPVIPNLICQSYQLRARTKGMNGFSPVVCELANRVLLSP